MQYSIIHIYIYIYMYIHSHWSDPCCSRAAGEKSRPDLRQREGSEGGMMRLETLIELKFINSSLSSLSSYRN